MLYIIARSMREAEDYARVQGLSKKEFCYVSYIEKLYGLKNPEIVAIGRYWDNEMNDRILQELAWRGAEVKHVYDWR